MLCFVFKAAARFGLAAAIFCAVSQSFCLADDTESVRSEIDLLKKQNSDLQSQLEAQKKLIDGLSQQVAGIKSNSVAVKSSTESADSELSNESSSGHTVSQFHLGNVAITGDAGAGFFNSEPNGQMNKATFRIDEARLFFDAPIWDDFYFYSEVDLASRESTSLGLNVGELYVEAEDLSKIWGEEKQLNGRVGRFYVPFGEEYQERFVMQNPLISHSVSDLWGTDDGVELYGAVKGVSYAVAVQNGGIGTSQALQNDKTVSGRLGYHPTSWLDLSASAMRTGNLNVNNGYSATWFGNGFFRSLGSMSTTTFHDNLVEGDVRLKFPELTLTAFGGWISYGDADPTAHNNRDVYYYSVEALHNWNSRFYSAARFSQVLANKGFPIVGNGNFNTYENSMLTTDYWRLSLGGGCHLSRNLLVKAEYSFNQGQRVDGISRSSENLLSLEIGCAF